MSTDTEAFKLDGEEFISEDKSNIKLDMPMNIVVLDSLETRDTIKYLQDLVGNLDD